ADLTTPEMVLHSPSSKCAGQFHDIFLRVSTIDSHCVKFHQLACIVLIRSPFYVGLPIEIDQHGTPCRPCSKQIPKLSERVWTYHFSIIDHLEPGTIGFWCEYIEMVAPKLDHHLQ